MWVVSHSTAVSQSSKRASRSPRTHASQPRRTISTFSCDIARPVSLQRLTVPSRTLPAAVGLLPHPGSFEGLVPIEVGLEAHDLPITYLIYAWYAPGQDTDAAAVSPSRGLDTGHDDRFARALPNLVRREAIVVPRIKPISPHRHVLIAAASDLGVRDVRRRMPLHFRVDRREHDLVVPSVRSVEELPHRGHALLRHRPPSIPQGYCSSRNLHELRGDLPAAATAYVEAARRATNVAERDHLVRQAARGRAAEL